MPRWRAAVTSRFDDLTPVEQDRLRREFENRDTTHERRVEILTMLQEGADETKFLPPCMNCKHVPFYAPWHEAVIEGHVYSHDGLREIDITGLCEYCFDDITAEPDEEEEPA